jgi:hypothetical protein
MTKEFITRTQEDILEYLKTHNSFFGFNLDVLLPYLSYAQATELADLAISEEEWNPHRLSSPALYELAYNDMKQYFAFALGKAEDHRGLSANRSVEKLCTWAWLLGVDYDFQKEFSYEQYGVPILAGIGLVFDFELPLEEEWFLNMGQGYACCEDCEEGCEV